MVAERSSKHQSKGIVIVTGSSGFIGAATIKRLAAEHIVVGFDLVLPPHPRPEAECLRVDLTSEDSIKAAFERVRAAYGERIASIVHLAAYFDNSGKPDARYEEVNVHGTQRLLGQAQAFGIEQFVFASTMLVHAPGEKGRPIDEDWPLDAKLPYPESKRRAEQLVREQRGPIRLAIIRPAGVYDDQCHNPFLAQQIARIYERAATSLVYPGDLDAGQSALHLSDLTEALFRIVERRFELPPETVLLLGEPETLSYGAIQKTLGRLVHDEDWHTQIIPKPLAIAGAWIEEELLDEDAFIRAWMVDASDDHYELDISRARTLLDWEPQKTLRTALPTMAASLKADPVGWYKANELNAAPIAATKPQEEGDRAHAAHEDEEMLRRHLSDMRKMHFRTIWVHLLNIALGLWLATSPFVLDLFGEQAFPEAVERVTAERGLWAPLLRNSLTGWSDVVSGMLIAIFGFLSLSPRFSWAQWGNAAVGLWLLFAPLVFWTPSAAAYANDTLVGALVITFAILVPMMPGMSDEAMMDPSDMPPGWTYSPSTYLQRLPIVALGLFGFLIARVLAAYQLGHIDAVWEPFFGGDETRNGTEFIITSEVSRAWPIADGGLGATTYMLEVLSGAMGGRARWRTMPWMVFMFGVAVVPLGVVSIYFIVIQPIEIGTYCTLCLIAALAMLIMIPYSLDELVAMGQFLVLNRRRGRPFWRSFFRGDALPGSGKDTKPDLDHPGGRMAAAAEGGVTVPWTLLVSALLGVWLMFSRVIFGTAPPMADSDHLVGALVITVAVIAMAEVARPLRFINVALGLWLIVAPWILAGESLGAAFAGTVTGIVLIGLSLPRGARSEEHYGSWDRFVV